MAVGVHSAMMFREWSESVELAEWLMSSFDDEDEFHQSIRKNCYKSNEVIGYQK